jgi:hypothetical protein
MHALYRVSDTGARVLNSQVAHIHARRENGPRWNPAMAEAENRGYGNLILLCLEHASEIDATPELYPPEMLRDWKRIQIATQEQAARLQPALTDAEADDVSRRSFGRDDVAAIVAAAVPFSARSRSRHEALDRAVRQSLARRMSRLVAIPAGRQAAVLAWMSEHGDPVVAVPEGQVRVLVAPMGAGKSEHASRWWDEGLQDAQVDAGTEIPVWLDARRVTQELDAAITAALGRDPTRPCRVVIDNLDGVSPGQAGQLLDEARQLVRTWPATRVLATSRPGAAASDEELITVAPWLAERGTALVRVVTGDTGWHSWTTEAVDLLTSPLAAIAVAARLLSGRDVRVSRLILLRDLAQTIIQQKRRDWATPQLWDEFARLAAHILSAPGQVTAASFGNEAQVWQLTDTGLVVSDGGVLRFALPVFEQHFGAQALRSGIVGPEAAAGPESFPRWRYAVAFALADGEPDQAEQYTLPIARTNPAAVSWVLGEIAEGARPAGRSASEGRPRPPQPRGTGPASPGDPAITEGLWLREALQALLVGFGTCGSQLARHSDGRLVQWGVQLRDDWMALSEARTALPPPDVVAVRGEPGDRLSPEWFRRTMFQLPADDLGRWSWARDRLRQPLAELIRRRRLPLPPGSPIARERQWILARQIMRIARKPHRAAIPLAELRKALEPMLETVERTVHSTWRSSGSPVDSDDIRWISARLQDETGDELCEPWPPPDLPGRPGRWAWQGYSPELTRTIIAGVLRDALVGYQDLVMENFSSFGWALGLNSVLPARARGTVLMPGNDQDGLRSSLTYELLPSREADPHVELTLVTVPEPWRRPSVDAPGENRRRTPFYVPVTHNTFLPTGQSRPATNLAYQWLAADLHALGWLDNAPFFHD